MRGVKIIKMEKDGQTTTVVESAFEKVWKNKGWKRVEPKKATAKKTAAKKTAAKTETSPEDSDD
jgi:hypothetical protein